MPAVQSAPAFDPILRQASAVQEIMSSPLAEPSIPPSEAFDRAHEMAQQICIPVRRMQTIGEIALAQQAAGQGVMAQEMLINAERCMRAPTSADLPQIAPACRALAVCHARMGGIEHAEELAGRVFAQDVERRYVREAALFMVHAGFAHQLAGAEGCALLRFEGVERLGRWLEDLGWWQTFIVQAEAGGGCYGAAQKTAARIEPLFYRASAFGLLAAELVKAGRAERAEALLEDAAFGIFGNIPAYYMAAAFADAGEIAEAQERYAAAAAFRGDPELSNWHAALACRSIVSVLARSRAGSEAWAWAQKLCTAAPDQSGGGDSAHMAMLEAEIQRGELLAALAEADAVRSQARLEAYRLIALEALNRRAYPTAHTAVTRLADAARLLASPDVDAPKGCLNYSACLQLAAVFARAGRPETALQLAAYFDRPYHTLEQLYECSARQLANFGLRDLGREPPSWIGAYPFTAKPVLAR